MKYTLEQLKKQLLLLDEKFYEKGLTIEEAEEYDRLIKKIARENGENKSQKEISD